MRRCRTLVRWAAWLCAALVAATPLAYQWLFPVPTRYASDVDHFKYGSNGVEAAQGMPYEVWRTLPGLCLPLSERAGGFSKFGFQWEPGHATPVGMPVETELVPRIGVNCAMCHVGRIEGPDGVSQLIAGAPNTSLNLQAYLRFLFSCVGSDRFTADAVLAENARLGDGLNAVQRLFYRALVIPQMKTAIAAQAREMAFMESQPDWGPGRAPGFQPAKIQVLGIPFDGTLDIVDIPSLWAMQSRDGKGLHWDGANTSLHEVFLSSGIGNGATGSTIDLPSLARNEAWVRALPPPPYPWPIDDAQAQAGKAIYVANCASCHDSGGDRAGQVIPLRMIGTDRNRVDAFTPETAQGFAALADYSWRYQGFRKTGGYAAAPLDGIWARAPYLHNGAVPTLAALLTPPSSRPSHFLRGSPRYDPLDVGFSADSGTAFDTSQPGNGATGHDWGTDLSEPEKRQLIEYLKTL
ncbi:c-type cytochrome [Mesorhizobium sp. M0898]|uniref:c-type cytochrome n=1 Tax=Mesorhizobium sp. M0898 TaxID=2957020 RepID=UPI00333956D5